MKSYKINYIKKFWSFLREDSWQSWIVSIVLAFMVIRFVFFPLLSFAMASPLPLVVVESCSMYHSIEFDDWWDRSEIWYESQGISRGEFEDFPFKNGLNKGDIVFVSGRGGYDLGDVIIFKSSFTNPLIHRIVDENPLATKGDNNSGQLEAERNIEENQVIGKSIVKVPLLGWAKLIFFEPFRSPDQRGFCK